MSSEPVSTLNGFTLPSHELLINQVNQLTKTVGSMKETIKNLRSTVDLQQKEISDLRKLIESFINTSVGNDLTNIKSSQNTEQVNTNEPPTEMINGVTKNDNNEKQLNRESPKLYTHPKASKNSLNFSSSTSSGTQSFQDGITNLENGADENMMHLNVINEIDISTLIELEVGKPWPKILNKNRLSSSDETSFIKEEYKKSIIRPEELLFTRVIGRGSSASVYQGIYRNQNVAIKVFNFNPLDRMSLAKQQKEIEEELNVMSYIESENVVKFHGLVIEPSICIVMEYCSRGSLYDVLSGKELIDWQTVFRVFKEIVNGVGELHSLKPPIVHRDLKTLNILVTEDMKIKVADFGLSRLSEGKEHFSTLYKLRGTYSYCAPEVYHGEQFTDKADVYSLGIILWELVSKCVHKEYRRPYSEYTFMNYGFQVIIQSAKKGIRPTIPPCPSILQDLICRLWSANPALRPDCAKLYKQIEKIEALYFETKEDWDSGALNVPERKDIQIFTKDLSPMKNIPKNPKLKFKKVSKQLLLKKDKKNSDKKKQGQKFYDLQTDERLHKSFGEFLKKEFCEEYFNFWEEANALQNEKKDIPTVAKSIYNKYLKDEVISVGPRELKTIKDKIENNNIDSKIFDEVRNEVESLLRTKFLEFQNSQKSIN